MLSPRETDEYKEKRYNFEQMTDQRLALILVYRIYREMKYKKALNNPGGHPPEIEEYALDDTIINRLA